MCNRTFYLRALGLQSLPVAFGVEKAKWLTVGTIDITQLLVAAYLFYLGESTYALVLLGLIAPQASTHHLCTFPSHTYIHTYIHKYMTQLFD